MSLLQVTATSILIFLLCLSHVAPATGSGPDVLERPQVWNFTTDQCGLLRNETIFRPYFIVWQESVKGVPFRYCCEYQPPSINLSPTSFNLSRYSNSLEEYHFTSWYRRRTTTRASIKRVLVFNTTDNNYHFSLIKHNYRPPLFGEVTDLYRLYAHRRSQACVQAFRIAAPIAFAFLPMFGINNQLQYALF